MSILYGFSSLLYVLAFYIVGYRKKLVYQNLAKSFPSKGDQEIRKLRKAFYKRFADFVVETLKGISISRESLTKRVTFKNIDILQPYHDRGQSVVLAGSHQFNWEWALQAGCVQLPFPVDAIYQSLSNQKFDQLMYDIRSRFGGHPINKSNALREIIKGGARLKAIAINADQIPHVSNNSIYWAEMLNQDTAFYHGVEMVTKLIKGPAFFIFTRRLKRGHYEIEFIKLAEFPFDKGDHSLLDNYVKMAERQVLEDIPGWLWSHRRWKYKKPVR